MANQGRYTVLIDTKVNDKSGIKALESELLKLESLAQGKNLTGDMKTQFEEAAKTARQLRDILDKSWNSKLGQLDLSQVQRGLKTMGKSVADIKNEFSATGNIGAAAYNRLAQQIVSTNVQLKQSSKLLDSMKTSFGNTVRWGISSSIFNNMTGQLEKAWSFAKGLDSSLNSIRIVTGKNADEMARFAKQANTAAQILGASTRDFTDASLIYFQQGLGDKDAIARTETTIKMANVLGASADEVSNYMTAIWNNFDNGSKSLEYYGDVITALGAATASSSEEIATGLEKFASVADTIGLSYEYATSALATVTATTRQSADVVGTAFKTLFSRIQGLSLGETLEDGTDLNKYSKALASVGINIKEQNGELKNMDVILDEMGAKWTTLSKDQQVALAQTVAGVRQYNQMISLMNNWDFMKENIETARSSLGTLTQQQNIYMDSVDAHLQKLSTEFEDTYNTIMDDDAIKTLADAATGVLSVFNSFLKGIGGGMNDIIFFGGVITSIFSDKIGKAIEKQIENSERLKNNVAGLQLGTAIVNNGVATSMNPNRADTEFDKQNQEILREQIEGYSQIAAISNSIGEEKANQLIKNQKDIADIEARINAYDHYEELVERIGLVSEDVTAGELKDKDFSRFINKKNKELEAQKDQLDDNKKAIQEYQDAFRNSKERADNAEIIQSTLIEPKLQFDGQSMAEEDKNRLLEIQEKIVKNINLSEEDISFLLKEQEDDLAKIADDLAVGRAARQANKDMAGEERDTLEQTLELKREQQALDLSQEQRAASISALTSAIGQTVSMITATGGLFKLWSDKDVSTGEKILGTLTVMASMIPMVISLVGAMKTLTTATNMVSISNGVMTLTATGATIGIGGLTKAFFAAIPAALGFKAAVWEFYLIAAVVTAIIGAVVVAIKAMSDAYNADAINAQRAADAAKGVADSNKEVQESLQGLESAFDAYDAAVEKLENCTRGTEEWKEALDEVNDSAVEALEQLSNFKNISAEDIQSLYQRNAETGMIEFDQDKVQKIKDSANQVALGSQYAEYASEFHLVQAQMESDMIDLTRSMSDNALNMTDALSAATMGINGLVLANELEAQVIQDEVVSHLDEFTKAMTLDEFKKKMNQLGMDLSGVSENEMQEYKDKITELAQSTDAASKKLQALAEIKVDEVLGDEYSAGTKVATSKKLTDEQNTLKTGYEKLLESNKGDYISELKRTSSGINKASGADNEIYKEVLSKLRAAGMNVSAQKDNAVRGDDNNRSLAFLKDGEEVVYNSEQIAEMIASDEAVKKLEENAKKIKEALGKMTDSMGEEFANGIDHFLETGDLTELTEDEFNKLAEMSTVELANAFGAQIDNDGAWGEMMAKNYLKALQIDPSELSKAEESYKTALDDFKKKMQLEALAAFEGLDEDTEQLTLAGKQAIAKLLNDAIYYGTEDTMNTIKDTFNKVDGKNLQGFTNAVQSVSDWSNISASELKDSLESMGIVTGLSTEELERFIEAMKNTSAATLEGSAALRKAYKDIADVVKDLERGDTIKKEDYDKLSSAAQEYFTLMMDGTYKLTANAERLQETIQKEQINKFQDEKGKLSNQIIDYNRISSYDFDKLSQSARNKDTNTYQRQDVEQQLDILKTLGGDQEKYQKMYNDLNEGDKKMNTSNLEELAKAVKELQGSYEGLDNTIAQTKSEIFELELSVASSFTTYDELKQALDNGTIGATAFNKAYNEMHEAQRTDDLDLEELNDYADYIQDIAKESKDFADTLSDNEEACENLATEIMRMDDGLENLADNWEEWGSILKKSSKSSQEYQEAMAGTREAVADLLDMDKEYVSNSFIEEHLKDIEAAAKGDTDAIERLREASLDSVIMQIDFKDDDVKNRFVDTINQLKDIADNANLTVGASMDLSNIENGANDLINYLNQMLMAGEITEADLNNTLSAIGYDPVYTQETYDVPQKIPQTTTHHRIANFKMVSIGDQGLQGPTWDDITTVETQMVDVAGTQTIGGIGTEQNPPSVKVHKLANVSKKATSSYSNYSSKNSGGSPLGGKKSGGGSKKEAKKEDPLKDELDVYHDINIAIKKVETELGRLQKQQEKLFGSDLINNLNQQMAKLNKQMDNYKTKIGIARQEQARMQQELAKNGIAFNADGTIANYAAAYKAQFNYVNSVIQKYNAMSAEAQESYKEVMDKAKEDFQDFIKLIGEYDTLVSDTIPGLEDQIQDAVNQEIEINITKFNMEIEIRLNLAEAAKEWNEFKRRIIDGIEDDDILGTAASRLNDYGIYYNADNTGIIQANTKHVNDTLAQLDQMDKTGWSDFYGDNRQQALEDLQTYYQQLMSDLEEVADLVEEIRESYLDLMDEAQEKFDEQIENFEFISDQLEHDIALTQLIKGTDVMAGVDSYDLLDKYYSQQDENYQKQIKFQQSQVEFWKEQMDGAEYASDEWDSAREKWMSATSELNSLIETSIENLQNKYLNAIDGIFNNLNNKVTNGFGLDYVSEQWDLINQNADQYLDTVNRAFGIQQLANKYQNAIDLTDSLSAQRKLNKLMEKELKALREKDKLTQYDIDRANKKYEIALKQIAIEEAQQNKSKLRLKRDSQGNYSYQYVADDDEIAKLKDEMSGLYNDLYNFDLNRYKENLNQVYSVWDEMQSKMYEVYQDTTLSEEERLEKITLLQEQYGELINGIIAENEVVRLNLQESTYLDLMDLYHENEVAFEGMTTEQTELINSFINGTLEDFMSLSEGERDIMMGEMIPQWNSGVQQMVDTIAGEGGFFPTCKDAFEQLEQKARDLGDAIMTTLGNAKVNFNDLKNATDETVFATQRMIDAMDNLTESYGGQLLACRGVINELKGLQTAYKNAEDASKKAAQAAYEYWAAVNNKAASEAQKATSSNQNSSNQPATQSRPASPQGNGSVDVGDSVTYTGGYYYATSYGTGSKGNRGPGRRVTVTQVIPGRAYPIHVQSSNSAYGWLKQSQISGYDTGGYTGEWNNSGRLAFLHQKELVLNAQDTKNMLAAVEIIRKVTDSVGAGLLARMAGLNASASAGVYGNNSEAFEQNVHITAEFPSVTKSSEIENALNNLINTASQRVHSK